MHPNSTRPHTLDPLSFLCFLFPAGLYVPTLYIYVYTIRHLISPLCTYACARVHLIENNLTNYHAYFLNFSTSIYIYIYIYTRTCSCIFAQVHARVHARTPPEQNKNAQVFLKLKHVRRKKKRRRRSDRKRKKRSRLTLTEIYKHSHSKKKKKKKKKYLGALKDATSTFHIHAEWGRLKIDV